METQTTTENHLIFKADGPLISEAELAAKCKVSRRTVKDWRKNGFLPKAAVIAGRALWEPLAIGHWFFCLTARRPDPVAFPVLETDPKAKIFGETFL